MIIENSNGMTVLYAEGTNKITNKDKSFFSDMVYLGINDNVNNYEEVTRDIWKNFVEIPSDYDIIEAEIGDLKSNQYLLEDCLIDTDYRLLILELEKEYQQNLQGGMGMYDLLKRKIERQSYKSKEDMQIMLDTYYFAERITTEEYRELTTLLAQQ